MPWMSEIAFWVLPWPSAYANAVTLGHLATSCLAAAVVTRRQLLPPKPSVRPSTIFFGPHHDGVPPAAAPDAAAGAEPSCRRTRCGCCRSLVVAAAGADAAAVVAAAAGAEDAAVAVLLELLQALNSSAPAPKPTRRRVANVLSLICRGTFCLRALMDGSRGSKNLGRDHGLWKGRHVAGAPHG